MGIKSAAKDKYKLHKFICSKTNPKKEIVEYDDAKGIAVRIKNTYVITSLLPSTYAKDELDIVTSVISKHIEAKSEEEIIYIKRGKSEEEI